MTWSKSFKGTRHEIVSAINAETFPVEAEPIQACRQFIAGQLPTSQEDTETEREFMVSASGGITSSRGSSSNTWNASVTAGAVRKPKPSGSQGDDGGDQPPVPSKPPK